MVEERKTRKNTGDKKRVKFKVCQSVWYREKDHTHAIKVHDLKLQHATFLQGELTFLRLFHCFFSGIEKSKKEVRKKRINNNI